MKWVTIQIQKRTLWVLKKLMVFLGSLLLLSAIVFAVARLTPMDPLRSYYGERVEKMNPEEKERARERLGLGDPLPVQYVRWLGRAAKGDFGISYKYKQKVTEVIGGRIINTLLLGGTGFVLIFAGACALGVACAGREDGPLDRTLCTLGTVTSCIPEFWLSLLLILVFSVLLRLLPSGGAYSVGKAGDPLDRLLHLVLPCAVVVLGHLWYYAYMVRNMLLAELSADYVVMARAKGLSKGRILWVHCLRNVLPAFFSLMAVSVPHILGGTYIVETVFSYPGIGALSYESARFADYNLLMVLCLLTGAVVIFSSFVGQVLGERIDPRLRREEEEGELW